jgi:hypothetical protein
MAFRLAGRALPSQPVLQSAEEWTFHRSGISEAARGCIGVRLQRKVHQKRNIMEYLPLGNTGLKVSRICLGCMSYGSKKWRDWVLEEPEALPFFRQALDAGINFFDTADMYSATLRVRKCL